MSTDRIQQEAQAGDEPTIASERGIGHEIAVEYEALTRRVALVDDSERRIVEVSGPRAREMVNGLVTNTLQPLAKGRCAYAFMLTAKGRVVAEMRVIPKPAWGATGESPLETELSTGEVWLDTPAACADALLAHLRKYLPPLYARFEATDVIRLGAIGPVAPEAMRRLREAQGWPTGEPAEDLDELQAAPLGPDRGDVDSIGDPSRPRILLVRREASEGPGFDLYAAAAEAESTRAALREVVEELGGSVAGRAAREIVRVERGVPAYGREITIGTLPQETGQTQRAVSFEKGCYTGQEVVARIQYRGHVNRRLVGFSSEEAGEPLSSGAPLYLGERRVADVCTVVRSPRHGSIALGYARREIDAGETLSPEPGGSGAVRVRRLPFT